MQNVSLQQLVDRNELQLLQGEICRVAGVYACCVNRRKESITEISNTGSGVFEGLSRDELQALRISPHSQRALERVEPDSLEDTAVEAFPGGRVAAISITLDNEFLFYWLLFDCSNREEGKFAQVLDLVRDMSHALYKSKFQRLKAELAGKKVLLEQQQMSKELRRNEATSGMAQLLDSDDPLEIVMERWLRVMGQHLQVESAELFQVSGVERTMSVLASWCNRGIISPFERVTGLDACTLFQTDKPLVYSAGTIPAEHMWEANYYGWAAIMVFPVMKKDDGSRMVLTVEYRSGYHNWDPNEVKFTADAVKMLQGLLTNSKKNGSSAGSDAVLQSVLDNVENAVYVTDKRTGAMLFANKNLRETFFAEIQDRSFDTMIERSIAKNPNAGTVEVFFERSLRWYEMTYKEIVWVDGKNAMMYSFIDITDKKQFQRKAERQDYTDYVTGLYNRRCCERDLALVIEEAKDRNETGAILYLDLDDFKHINDGLGHQYGDVLLKSVANALQKVNGVADRCYRISGDEFVLVVSPEVYPRINEIVANVTDIFSRPWYLKDADYYCTASIGIVTFPDFGETVAELMKKADIAIYEAKKGGKNRASRYSEDIYSESGRRLDMEKNMRDATAGGCDEFEIYFQPIMDIEGEMAVCVGAEALVRWNSLRQGFMLPADFLPLAEYLGLINPIGNYVLTESCKYCKTWNSDGHPEFKVTVNFSAVQLLQNNVVDLVENALNSTGLRPANLILDVTESLAISDKDRMKGVITRLKALGVQIALDDFGVGYSSLNHIREIPFDMIKIDKSYALELTESAYAQAFIKMTAELAQSIGMSVCVEGIEGPAQYRALHGTKVSLVQGYYFDKPLPRRAFEEKYVRR
ncbi:MAG: EAL domain-containing protein [Lachnospiraceae bacterium]|nr:EAL domain-containing protein [Lachnospiraceae bacterium]